VKQFIAFTKKELYESTATFRLYILIAVFILLGVMGPLMALLTPTILEGLAGGDSGIIIILPEPTAMDSWAQFFSGAVEMGMPILTIIFCGIMSNEFSKGTLINLLTKGLKRHTIILSKFTSAGFLWTIAFLLSVATCYLYTAIYWEAEAINHIFLVFGAPWLFGLFLIAILIFGGILFGNFYGSLFSSIGVAFVLMIANNIPGFSRFNPITVTGTISLIRGTSKPSDFIPAVIVCGILIIMLIIGSIAVFNRKKI